MSPCRFRVLHLLLVLSTVSSHVVWDHPVPRVSGDQTLKQYPCGIGHYNNFSSFPTTLSPGKHNVTFIETITHQGAPARIALTFGGDDRYDEFVLYDHIPHAVGGNRGDIYKIEVDIPDVLCRVDDRCALQVIQIMTDKFTSPCQNPAGLVDSCGHPSFAYFSCANILINGTSHVQNMTPFYKSYLGNPESSVRDPYVPDAETSFTRTPDGKYLILNQVTLNQTIINPSDLPETTSDQSDLPARTDAISNSASHSFIQLGAFQIGILSVVSALLL